MITPNDKPLVVTAIAALPEVKKRLNELQCVLGAWEAEYEILSREVSKVAMRESINALRKRIALVNKCAVELIHAVNYAEDYAA